MRESLRNPALDGLRGLAVLLVTLSHSNVPVLRFGGMVGVTVFFVLSGFLITSLLLTEKQRTGRISLRKFYVRRALRLFPALIVAVVIGSVLAIAFGQTIVRTLAAAGASLLYAANIAVVHGVSLAPFGAYWSLAMEEQYYLLWPVLLLGAWRIGLRAAILVTTLLAFASLAWRFSGEFWTPRGYVVSYYSPQSNAWALLAGSVLGLWTYEHGRGGVSRRLAIGAFVGVMLVSSVMGMRTGLREVAEPATYVTRLLAGPIAALPALVLVIYAAERGQHAVWLCNRTLVFFGSISYGLYLWHGVIDHVLGTRFGSVGVHGLVVGCVASIIATGVAVLSLRYVERPFLRYKAGYVAGHQLLEQTSALAS